MGGAPCFGSCLDLPQFVGLRVRPLPFTLPFSSDKLFDVHIAVFVVDLGFGNGRARFSDLLC